MVHHADFAVPVAHTLWLETRLARPEGSGTIAGRVLALGWWVDQPGTARADEPPTGTLYLIADEALPRPVWVAQGDLASLRLE
jgi:hypothetical protein